MAGKVVSELGASERQAELSGSTVLSKDPLTPVFASASFFNN